MFMVKREALNGPIVEEHELSIETICKVYELAERLLRTAIGAERIETLMEGDFGIKSDINLIEIADWLGITVYTDVISSEAYCMMRDEILEKEKEKGEIPYINQYDKKEIDYIAEVEIRKCLSKECPSGSRAIIRVSNLFSTTTQNFAIACGIAKIYFADSNLFERMVPQKFYVLGDWVYDTKNSMIEKMFAYALVAPNAFMCKLEEKYRQTKSKFPIDLSDWLQTLSSAINFPEMHAIYAWKCWKQYRYLKYSNRNNEVN